MPFQEKINKITAGTSSPANTFFSAAANTVQRQQDLPGQDPEPPRNFFTTPDSIGITNNKDNSVTLDIHIDYLPSHTRLHVFIANTPGGSYQQGAPLQIIGTPGKGGDFTVTLSPVPSHFYIRLEARSEKTNINVPNITGTCVQGFD